MRTVFFLLIILITSCSLPAKKLVGTYIDSERGDTLRIKADSTYTFDEKLMNGFDGFTRGEWRMVDGHVQLTVSPKILMGYGSKILKDSAASHPVFDFFLGASQQPVKLDEVDEYHEGLVSPAKNVVVDNNRLMLQKISFDSLDVGMEEFLPITIGPVYFTNNHYRVQITPGERYYEFDRYLFEYKKKTLRNINKEGVPKAYIILKKVD